MPTIDQLENVVVAADDDMLPVSQNGTVRRVSRSQLLAGTQTSLSLTPGLIGRASPGLGSPEHIAVGGGLTLSDGVLSGVAPYSVATLPPATAVTLNDLLPTWHNGQDCSVTIQTLLSVQGIDASNQVAHANLGVTRRISEWLNDAVHVEAFGAAGDGVTDDTSAITLAVASGRPVLFGPKTYRLDGQWTLQSSTTLIGIKGATILRRSVQNGGAWINVTASSLTSEGIIFDGGAVVGNSWGVLVTPTCTQTYFHDCSFVNVTGATLGTGLTIQARDGLTGTTSSHIVDGCVFQNNACHGLWIQAASGANISNCEALYNGSYGICLDFNDPLFQHVVRQSSIVGCRCRNNVRGISVGNYNSTNTEPPRWGLDNPDAQDVTVSGNICSDNSAYAIAVSGSRIQVVRNQILMTSQSAAGSGILCNASFTTVAGNSIVGPGQFGVDAGGSADSSLVANVIVNCAVALNAGGSMRMLVSGNKLVNNDRAVTLFQVETDGSGSNFGIACGDIWIEDNLIQLNNGDSGGIFLFDGPERVEITRNRFLAPTQSNLPDLCWAHTDSIYVHSNTLNGSTVAPAVSQASQALIQLIIPDIVDFAIVDGSTTKVDRIFGLHQSLMVGQVSFVRVTSGGTGYSQAVVTIAGSGTGAAGTAYLRDGVVIGVALSSGGSGYDAATTAAVITGDGVGASLQPFVGLPVPQDRRLSLRCLGPVRFTQGNVGGAQTNWTKTDITVAGGSEILFQGVSGLWEASWFSAIDYLLPGGDGSVSLRSDQGDIRLIAGPGGKVRFSSDLEQTGYLTTSGYGSPEGVVTAPPGSDYRNLSGGVGITLWLKRVGDESAGWFPVA